MSKREMARKTLKQSAILFALWFSLSVCLEKTLGFVSSTLTFCASSKACFYNFSNKKSILTLALKITSIKEAVRSNPTTISFDLACKSSVTE